MAISLHSDRESRISRFEKIESQNQRQALDKPGGFIGREVVARQKAGGILRKRLVQVKVTSAVGTEPLLRDGVIVGSIMSGAYGHRIQASLGLGYVESDAGVTKDLLSTGRWEVEVAMNRYPAEVQLGGWYDPANKRVKS